MLKAVTNTHKKGSEKTSMTVDRVVQEIGLGVQSRIDWFRVFFDYTDSLRIIKLTIR